MRKLAFVLWGKIRNEPLLSALIGVFVLLLLVFVAVMGCEGAENWISQLLGLSKKYEVLRALGFGMLGVLLILQALASHKRAKAMEDTANAQAKATEEQATANQNTEQGQRQERLKNAIEHLGHESDSVRLGGAYELFHLAEDTPELRQTVLDILCAHIRRTTGEQEYREEHKSNLSEEVQSLLTLLFVQKHGVFKGCRINLQGSWLNGANLYEGHLQGANMIKSYLRRAILGRAHLQYAILMGTHLEGAILESAHLQGSNLMGAQLHRANLIKAKMQGSVLNKTVLQGTTLRDTDLRGVATPDRDEITFLFPDRIRESIGQESDLSGAIGIGPNSGAIIGAYTVEEAEQWIAEYEEAMSEIPKTEPD